ncbi:MAG: hypothetical protein ABTQ34_03985 [Bdellovibrionales bacterium]
MASTLQTLINRTVEYLNADQNMMAITFEGADYDSDIDYALHRTGISPTRKEKAAIRRGKKRALRLAGQACLNLVEKMPTSGANNIIIQRQLQRAKSLFKQGGQISSRPLQRRIKQITRNAHINNATYVLDILKDPDNDHYNDATINKLEKEIRDAFRAAGTKMTDDINRGICAAAQQARIRCGRNTSASLKTCAV